MKLHRLPERANKQQPKSQSPNKLTTIYFGKSPEIADPLKNMNNITNSELLKEKYRMIKNKQFAHKKNKSLGQSSPTQQKNAGNEDRGDSKQPKICQIKYLEKTQQIFNETVCFRGLQKKRSLKGSKDLTEKRHKQSIKEYMNRYTPQPKTKTPSKKQQIKITLQTIYGTIESDSPRKFFPKILEEEKKFMKRNQVRKHQMAQMTMQNKDETPKYHNKYLMITNNEIIKNPRYVEQLERLKLSIENKRIEDKHRKMTYWRSENKEMDRTIINRKKMPTINKEQLSMTLTHKASSKPQRYSPWHKQKTQNQLLGEEYI